MTKDNVALKALISVRFRGQAKTEKSDSFADAPSAIDI
jgi:hypothetical protein